MLCVQAEGGAQKEAGGGLAEEERKARTVCRVAIDTRPTRLITCTSLIPVGKLQTGAVCRVQYRAGNEFPSHLQIVNVHCKSNNLIDPRANATVPF